MSFGHKVEPIEGPRRGKCRYGKRHPKRGCQERAEFVVSYQYVTGQAGRISSAKNARCPEHAQLFADNYDIPGPMELEETA